MPQCLCLQRLEKSNFCLDKNLGTHILNVPWPCVLWKNPFQESTGFLPPSSVQFSLSVVSDSLWPGGLQHARLPCPLPTPGAYSNSRPSIRSVMPSNHLIFCCPLLLPPSIFPSIGVFSNELILCIRWPKYCSFSFSINPCNEYSDCSPLGWTSWISLQSKGLSRVFSNTTVQKHPFFGIQLSL